MEMVLKDSTVTKTLLSPEAFVEFPDAEYRQPIHHRFERQAILWPDAPAVRLRGGDITYAELNAAANQAARRLLAEVGTAASPVALMMDQSYEAVLWTLAILKAGLPYAPLDQRLPEPVLCAMVENLSPGALIAGTRHRYASRKIAANRFPVISVAADRDGFSAANLHRPVTADSVAYIFYTSGSTGIPKGVADCHRNVLHNIQRYTNSLKFARGDVLSLVQFPSFSGAASSLFGALLNGAAIAPFDLQGEGLATLSEWVRRTQITVFHAVPAIFRQLSDPVARFPDIRLIRLEGDRASALDIEHFRANFQAHCTLVNGLGATECGLVRQFFIGKNSNLDEAESVPVGYPVPDMAVRIIDDRGVAARPGSTGEIVVESRFLATGYWRNPSQTAERFEALNGELRRYRTGDLGRMEADGCLIHLGRVDQRVRIAGEFVDPADIERLLLNIPGINQAAVRDFVDPSGRRRLCAYVVTDADAGVRVHRLRETLSERIPKHLVPAAFVVLDALPLTKDFKVDYQRLPQPGRQRPSLGYPYVPPRSPTETVLANIWMKLLGVERVGIRDNFFDLGGDSLLAVRLTAEFEEEFRKPLPVSALLQDATVEHLAKFLDHGQATSLPALLVPIQPQGTKRPFFCVHDLFGDVLCYANLARHLGQDQPFYGLEARGLKDGEEPIENIETMASHYIGQIRRVQPSGPYALGGFSLGGVVAFEMAQQLYARGDTVTLVALLDSNIRSENGQLSRGSFVLNLFRDLPSWINGSLQLTRRQWFDLIRVKLRARSSWIRSALGPAEGAYGDETDGKWVRDLAEVFGFSENHRKVALAQHEAQCRYRPGIYPGRITLFRACMQPFFSSHDRDNGWGSLAEGGVEVLDIPSNHLGMLREPHVRVLARRLEERLDTGDQ